MAPTHEIDTKLVERDFIHRGGFSSIQSNAPSKSLSALDSLLQGYSKHARSIVVAPITSSNLYLAIGIGVGGLLAIAIVVVATLAVKKRNAHRREITALAEERLRSSADHVHYGTEISRLNDPARRSMFVSWHKSGWNSFSSQDSLEAVGAHDPIVVEPRRAKSKRLRRRGIPLKKMKHLSAITESPRSKTKSPSFGEPENESTPEPIPQPQRSSIKLVVEEGDRDIFRCPDSPKPDVMPSYAIKSPGRYGVAIATNERMKIQRSISVGGVTRDSQHGTEAAPHPIRPQMHARSISLGTPKTRAPSGPVPPLPLRAAGTILDNESNRQGLLVRKLSCSSQDSANSSILITSPIIQLGSTNRGDSSPSVEQVIADDDHAELKNVSNRQWQNPRSKRRVSTQSIDQENNGLSRFGNESIHSNLAHYSMETGNRRVSTSSSISSSGSRKNRLSIPQMATANRVSFSRVSSTNSLNSSNGVKTVITPKKSSRISSVSAYGSPAQRKRPSVLRDISGNSVALSREHSAGSTSSSNGNPFKWDMPIQKPSAMKGSPNARKGHRRQNCVRISRLTPQVLGPPPSRPTSPNIMYGIEEEGSSEASGGPNSSKRTFVTNQRPSRPASTLSLSNNLRVQTLRASLTPSSPTLSQWNSYRDSGLPSQHSGSLPTASPRARIPSRPDSSSLYSIPTFPSPNHTTISAAQRNDKLPEFYLSRPSTDGRDDEENIPPFDHQMPLPIDIPSSPPIFTTSTTNDFDPNWRMITIPIPADGYDPTDPMAWDFTANQETTSPLYNYAEMTALAQTKDQGSPQSRPTSFGGEMPDTPPDSPKLGPESPETMPDGFKDFFDKKDSAERPTHSRHSTSHSASKKPRPPSLDFANLPLLSPTTTTLSPTNPPPHQHNPTITNTHPHPLRSAPSPPTKPTTYQQPNPDIPLPLFNKQPPAGPRSEPPKSVLTNAMALRRMNSEMNTLYDRESRCYTRLGREESVQLPLYAQLGDESVIDGGVDGCFDFGFGETSTGAGADDEGGEGDSRTPSVWEDGEEFWDVKLEDDVSSKQTPQPQGRSRPIAIQKAQTLTPGSLYDAAGFLRSSPARRGM